MSLLEQEQPGGVTHERRLIRIPDRTRDDASDSRAYRRKDGASPISRSRSPIRQLMTETSVSPPLSFHSD